MEDPDKGPLHRSLELPLLIAALKNDTSQKLEHLQQKVAVALSIAFGRNPANLTYIREEGFIDLSPESNEPCFILKIPAKQRLGRWVGFYNRERKHQMLKSTPNQKYGIVEQQEKAA